MALSGLVFCHAEVSVRRSTHQTHERSDRDQLVETSWKGLNQFLPTALQNLLLPHSLLMVSKKTEIKSYLFFSSKYSNFLDKTAVNSRF